MPSSNDMHVHIHQGGGLIVPYSKWSWPGPVDHAPLQEVCHGVVGHVYGGVRQRLHQVLLIPGDLGAEAVGTRAGVFMEPVQG